MMDYSALSRANLACADLSVLKRERDERGTSAMDYSPMAESGEADSSAGDYVVCEACAVVLRSEVEDNDCRDCFLTDHGVDVPETVFLTGEVERGVEDEWKCDGCRRAVLSWRFHAHAEPW